MGRHVVKTLLNNKQGSRACSVVHEHALDNVSAEEKNYEPLQKTYRYPVVHISFENM